MAQPQLNCFNDGESTCDPKGDGVQVCSCKGKFTPADKCASCACKNGGSCSTITGDCICATDWRGELCTEVCSRQDTCNGNGVCNSDTGRCTCDAGFTTGKDGKICATPLTTTSTTPITPAGPTPANITFWLDLDFSSIGVEAYREHAKTMLRTQVRIPTEDILAIWVMRGSVQIIALLSSEEHANQFATELAKGLLKVNNVPVLSTRPEVTTTTITTTTITTTTTPATTIAMTSTFTSMPNSTTPTPKPATSKSGGSGGGAAAAAAIVVVLVLGLAVWWFWLLITPKLCSSCVPADTSAKGQQGGISGAYWRLANKRPKPTGKRDLFGGEDDLPFSAPQNGKKKGKAEDDEEGGDTFLNPMFSWTAEQRAAQEARGGMYLEPHLDEGESYQEPSYGEEDGEAYQELPVVRGGAGEEGESYQTLEGSSGGDNNTGYMAVTGKDGAGANSDGSGYMTVNAKGPAGGDDSDAAYMAVSGKGAAAVATDGEDDSFMDMGDAAGSEYLDVKGASGEDSADAAYLDVPASGDNRESEA